MVNGIEVDTDKAQKMMRKIIINEKKNLSTKELDNLKMTDTFSLNLFVLYNLKKF